MRRAGVPVGQDPLQVERRELALDLVVEGEVELDRLARLAVTQRRAGLAEVVVAVVAEEDDLAADLRLEPPRRRDLGERKRRGKKPQGCWPKQMTGVAVMVVGTASARAGRVPSAAWSTRLKQHARRAADEIVPEIADVQARRRARRPGPGPRAPPRRRRSADPPQEERHQEHAEHHAVEDRADDVDRLDQVLRQVGEQGEADRDQAPEHGEPLRGG